MNPQFKKGVLELIVLESVRRKDMYGYELVEEVSEVIDVNEGTIYPLLKRLTNERYFDLSAGVHRGAAQKVLSSDGRRNSVPGAAGGGMGRVSGES